MLQVHSSYFVCFTPRSGSTLLCEALSTTGVAGWPEEYLPDDSLFVATRAAIRPPEWKQDWGHVAFRECLTNVFAHGTTPNGVFGAKVKPVNLRYLKGALSQEAEVRHLPLHEQLAQTFPDLRYVWITRRDKVRQAVSLFKARQSRTWISRLDQETKKPELSFNFQMIEECLRSILHRESEWAEYFASSGAIPFTVVYEDLVADHDRTVQRVLEYLGITLPAGYEFPAPTLNRQADAVTDDWIDRFREAEGRRMNRQWLVNLPQLLRDRALREAFAIPGLQARGKRFSRRIPRVIRDRHSDE